MQAPVHAVVYGIIGYLREISESQKKSDMSILAAIVHSNMIIRKNTTLYRHLLQLGFVLKDSKVKGHVYVEKSEGYLLTATNYRYVVDEHDNLNEWLDFSIIHPDSTVTDTLLYVPVD